MVVLGLRRWDAAETKNAIDAFKKKPKQHKSLLSVWNHITSEDGITAADVTTVRVLLCPRFVLERAF
jgi:hypothetical protein